MNEDGSAERELVDVSQVPSMEHLGDPSVLPNGTEVAFDGRWNQAYYEQNHWGSAPGMCGGNCEGIYELVNGAATRVTNAPFDCGAQPCESQEINPRVARDGSVAYVFQTYVSQIGPQRLDARRWAVRSAGTRQRRRQPEPLADSLRRDERRRQGGHRRRRPGGQSARAHPDRLRQLPGDHQRRQLRRGLDQRLRRDRLGRFPVVGKRRHGLQQRRRSERPMPAGRGHADRRPGLLARRDAHRRGPRRVQRGRDLTRMQQARTAERRPPSCSPSPPTGSSTACATSGRARSGSPPAPPATRSASTPCRPRAVRRAATWPRAPG